MASLNPNIAMSVRSPKFEQPDPIEQYSKGLQLKSLLTQQRGADQALADDAATRQAFQVNAGDQNAVLKALMSGGQYKAAQALQKQMGESSKLTAEGDKLKGEVTNQAIARHRDQLSNVNDPQSAAAWVQSGYQDPNTASVLGRMMPVEEAVKRIPTDPTLFQQWKQQAALGATKYIEQNKPTYQTRNLGGTTDTIALPGLGGPVQTVSSMRNSQSPDSIASQAVTMRGQNMTDTRARENNALKSEENAIKRGEKQETANLTKNSQVASFDTMLGTLDRLGKHPGLERSVGLTGAFPSMPGSEASNFGAELETFQSQAFIPMVAQLKGMGALSDAEGRKLTAAVGALNPKMGETAFRESIKRITDDMENARARVSGQPIQNVNSSNNTSAAKPIKTADDYNKLPSGATYIDPNGQTRKKP